jgi:type IV pilus assembly protein PilM
VDINVKGVLQNLGNSFTSLQKKKSGPAKLVRSIGLNIGKANIVGCEIAIQGDIVTLERCARIPIKEEESLAKQIKEFCGAIGFESRRLNLSVKGQGIVVRFLNFPRMGLDEFKSSIRFEAEKYLPFNISEVVLDYHINRRPENAQGETMEVILIAARRTEIEKMVHEIKPSGLIIHAIDVDIFACMNSLLQAVPESKGQVAGLVDFGATDTTLCICEKGHMTFSRDIAFGGNDMTEMIRKKLDIAREDAAKIQLESDLSDPVQLAAVQEGLDRLFQELKLSLNYFFNQHQNVEQLDALYISGGFSQLSILPKLLQEKLGIPVKEWDASAQMALSETITRESLKPMIPYLPVCTGLALRTK